jgi:arsenite oxidase large subunit
MTELSVKPGNLVEVNNDDSSTQAMAYPTPSAQKGHTLMLFAFPTGVQGTFVNGGTNELILHNY